MNQIEVEGEISEEASNFSDTSLRSSLGGDKPRPYVATVFFKGADLVAWFLNGLRLPGFTMLDHGV